MSDPHIVTVSGAGLLPHIPALARLRIAVFRDWPYLYDGDAAYEERYLAAYARSPRAAVVLAVAGEEVVGASTCLPLADETANLRTPFEAQGIAPERVFYFGESILLPAWRGHGIGVRFFDEREAHARRVSTAGIAAFCAVARPESHPAHPADYQPLDGFWHRRGYQPARPLACTMNWRDRGEAAETPHRLDFWWRSLDGRPLPFASPAARAPLASVTPISALAAPAAP